MPKMKGVSTHPTVELDQRTVVEPFDQLVEPEGAAEWQPLQLVAVK